MNVRQFVLNALNRALRPAGISLQRYKVPRAVVNTDRPMTRALCASSCFKSDPVAFVDVGCAGGLDERWRLFGDQMRALGIDAMTEECDRLRSLERNPAVKYVDARVGVARDHPVVRGRPQGALPRRSPWERLSVASALAIRRRQQRGREEALRSNEWPEQPLSPRQLTVDELVATQSVSDLDFLKIDVDGPDYEILAGFMPHLSRLQTLGLKLEINFHGDAEEDTHTFHNTDRLMRRNGFDLYWLSTRNYSMSALPADFAYGELGPTSFGRIFQGDAIYFRDPLGESPADLSVVKLLKLACLFELYDLPDCAAEILLRFREKIARSDTDQLLNLLVPRFDGARLPYTEYLARFNADPRSFL